MDTTSKKPDAEVATSDVPETDALPEMKRRQFVLRLSKTATILPLATALGHVTADWALAS